MFSPRLSHKNRWYAMLFGLLFVAFVGAGGTTVRASLQTPTAHVSYGVNVDMTALIPNTPYTITTATGGDFFALATSLGINTLRITDFQWENTGHEYPQAAWQRVFNEAAQHHMAIILQLMDGHGHTAIEEVHILLEQYGLARASALWMVDLYNEPDLTDPRRMAELYQEAAYIRQAAPAVPITIGGWKRKYPGHPGAFIWQDPSDIPALLSLVDVVSPHLYQFDQAAMLGFTPQQWTQRYLSAVRRFAPTKPILLEEFGASNGLAPTGDLTIPASPDWQASVYRGVLQEVTAERNQGVLGAVAWIIAPRTAWPNDPSGDMTGVAFVLNHGRQLLPAAQAFSAIAHQASH